MMLCPQNDSKKDSNAAKFVIPVRAREQIRATFTLLLQVIIQVSGSKFMLNHCFMGFLLYFIFGFVLVILLVYFACDLYKLYWINMLPSH